MRPYKDRLLEFETEKRKLQMKNLPPRVYEQAIKELSRKLRI